MEHLKHLLEGMRQVLVFDTGSDYIRPSGGFVRDAERLRGDVRRLGRDMTRETERYGKQINNRQG